MKIITNTNNNAYNFRTDIIDRNFNNYSKRHIKKILRNKLNISFEEYDELLKDYLVRLSDGYYYSKMIELKEFCCEAIGRYLCRKVNLETTNLEISEILYDKIIIVTPNYRKRNNNYYSLEDNFEFEDVITNYNDWYFEDLDKELQDELLKLIAIDLMMEQTDRYARNMEVYSDISGNKHLSPIIDFAFAFENINNYSYFNPYIAIEKMPRVLSLFYNKYPEGFPYFKKIFSSCSEELFAYIEDNYPVKVDLEVKDNIRKTIDKNQKILKLMNRG